MTASEPEAGAQADAAKGTVERAAARERPLRDRAGAAPRRLRLEVRGLFDDPPRAARIERACEALDGVATVHASSRSGRVLVVFDRADAAVREAVVGAIDRAGNPEAPPPPRLRDALRRGADVARGIARRLRGERPDGGAGGEVTETAPDWHAQPAGEVLRALGVDARSGLSPAEAKRALRVAGPNVLAGIAPRSELEIVAGQLATVPTALLASAAGLSIVLGDLWEAGAIALVVGSNIAVGYFTESRAEELLNAWGELRAEWARVVRGGQEQVVRAIDLVPGDVLVVRAGDPVAADARLVELETLGVDESTLTGESEPSEKTVAPCDADASLADRRCMLYAGATVASGEARAVVVATGERTELGAVQRALSRGPRRAAPLERDLDQMGKGLAAVAALSSLAVVGLGLLRGRPGRALAKSAIALGVAAIPEGLPAVGTTALALASKRLFADGIVIRRLAAAETLGAVSVVCADKTGTLTENRMRVEELELAGDGRVRVAWPDGRERAGSRAVRLEREDGRPPDADAVRELARIAALNADVEVAEDGVVESGSGTERALVEFAMAVGYDVPERRRSAPRVGERRRTAVCAFMTTVHEHPELGRVELTKGAPEHVIAICDGLDAPGRAAAVAANDAMASRGLRVLALAWRRGAPVHLVGLVGLRDPARPGVREAIETLEGAGVQAYMLTGDQRRTALAIAAALGMRAEATFSRVTPEAKVDIVEELQAAGHLVAMTGDGVNDGPALKAADVGVAMGRRGTDVARAVADVVLANDDLPSLALAIAEGRRLYDNVRRAIAYLVTTNLSEVLAMLFGAVADAPPLGPLHLLWLNLLTDVAPALALAIEPAEDDVMRRPPRDPERRLFERSDLPRIGAQAGAMTAASLASYAFGAARHADSARRSARARSVGFLSLVTAQLLHTNACRARASEPNPVLERTLWASFALQAVAIGSPAARRALAIERLDLVDVLVALAAGAAPSVARALARGSRRTGELVVARRAVGPASEERRAA
jgi:Ca2+-transporting ATPase